MAFVGDQLHSAAAEPPGASSASRSVGAVDPRIPLVNLSAVQARMDLLQKFLSDSVNSNTLLAQRQMDTVASEISSAIHEIIVHGAAILSSSSSRSISDPDLGKPADPDPDPVSESELGDCEIIEMDAVEILAENAHFCEICGKGFKRDANLRMHMRAHGDHFKTPEALGKPAKSDGRRIRFSCPFVGCNRHKEHKKFRPLKTVICVKNHFKRSHCPKMYSCTRCNKKSFSVLADLKSHFKHCGESKWMCSCGTSFSRKDKLFGHVALFKGHMPAFRDEEEKETAVAVVPAAPEEEVEEDVSCEIIEMDAVELLAEYAHFCDICGKGFKRDANLRMHMRAHGDQFKTLEALGKTAKTDEYTDRRIRFSCPSVGCNRNKLHKKFRPLKNYICVKNHFKRSHCPKMYSCTRCDKKSFSVMADLKTHLKHCGESKWTCSCGTSFSRKDKLFGHMALFEGHMPAVAAAPPENGNDGFVGMFDGLDPIEHYSFQDAMNEDSLGFFTF